MVLEGEGLTALDRKSSNFNNDPRNSPGNVFPLYYLIQYDDPD